MVNESRAASRSPYGERGLKCFEYFFSNCRSQRRSPYGERGLKYGLHYGKIWTAGSLSLRRAWIEIRARRRQGRRVNRRSPYGERGLK